MDDANEQLEKRKTEVTWYLEEINSGKRTILAEELADCLLDIHDVELDEFIRLYSTAKVLAAEHGVINRKYLDPLKFKSLTPEQKLVNKLAEVQMVVKLIDLIRFGSSTPAILGDIVYPEYYTTMLDIFSTFFKIHIKRIEPDDNWEFWLGRVTMNALLPGIRKSSILETKLIVFIEEYSKFLNKELEKVKALRYIDPISLDAKEKKIFIKRISSEHLLREVIEGFNQLKQQLE